MYMSHHMGYGVWGLGWMMLWWIILLAFIILTVWLVIRMARSEPANPGDDRPPEQIVRTRYARGEISREVYEQMMADLQR